MPQKGRHIEEDGLRYFFQPGKEGSLTAPAPKKQSLMDFLSEDRPRNGKVVMPESDENEFLDRNQERTSKVIMPPKIQIARNMASGGVVDDLDEEKNKNLYAFLSPPSVQAAETSGDTVGENPPMDANIPMKEDPVEKVVDSHPGLTPQSMQDWVGAQKAEINKYGPDQEKAVLDNIIKDRNSLGRKIGSAGSTFADALMQGVARAGNPGFAQQFEERQNTTDQLRADEIPKLGEMNRQNMEANQKLDTMTSSSPLGASYVAPLTAFFEKMGVPKEEIPKMLENPTAARSVVDQFAAVMTSEQKLQMDMLMKQLELSLQHKKLDTQTSIDKEKSALDQQNAQANAAEKLSKMSKWDKYMHPEDVKKLEEIRDGGVTAVKEAPFGVTTVRNGKTYVWSPVSKKYHLQAPTTIHKQ